MAGKEPRDDWRLVRALRTIRSFGAARSPDETFAAARVEGSKYAVQRPTG